MILYRPDRECCLFAPLGRETAGVRCRDRSSSAERRQVAEPGGVRRGSDVRLARTGAPGAERPTVVEDEGALVDVSSLVGDFDPAFFSADGLRHLAAVDLGDLPRVADGVRFGPCVARPGKIVCIGLNYVDHAQEASMEIPQEPLTFLKAPSSLCGAHDDLLLPVGGDQTDWEVELGVVIGSRARYLTDEETALQCVAGWCVSNDVSERGFQLERGGQWSKGKSAETFNPFGPYLVTPDDAPDLDDLRLSLAVNDEVRQEASTKDMIFKVGEIIRYLSQFMVLEPGDIVNTGTPPGTGLGRDPHNYLVEGDVMEASVTGLGTQRQRVVRARP
jgi:2-keto-4-pentenoate hydratase/2-oxohepta-3-ene-1,7-dioic acid hydratase in catechol pathway